MLRLEVSDQPLIHVEDISPVLNDQQEPMFVDLVHYTDQATAILANYIAGIVKRLVDSGACNGERRSHPATDAPIGLPRPEPI